MKQTTREEIKKIFIKCAIEKSHKIMGEPVTEEDILSDFEEDPEFMNNMLDVFEMYYQERKKLE
jgi:hypothetical protein